jgi:hypothetical protein
MKLRLALATLAAGAAAAAATQAAPISANTTAQASIVAPNTVTATRNLQFGSIAKPTSGTSTVTVASAASGAATPGLTGGGNAFIPTTGQAHAATFRIVGTAGQTYSVTNNTLAFSGAGANLTDIGAESPVAGSGTLNTLPGSGQDDLHIGGHFDITPTTAVNTYNGTLSVTVDFN